MTKEAVSSFEVSKDAVTEVKESRGEKGCSPAGLFWFMIGMFCQYHHIYHYLPLIQVPIRYIYSQACFLVHFQH